MQCRQCGTTVQEQANFCPECGRQLLADAPSAPPGVKSKGSRNKWIIAALLIAVLALGLTAYFNVLFRTFHPVIEHQPSIIVPISYGVDQKNPSRDITARMDRGSIVVPLAAVRDHKLVRFFDPEQILTVPMLAYVTPEGKVVTAMSKSEQCGSTEFFLEGHNIHCAQCPSVWNMSSLEAYACCQRFYPDPFPSTVMGDNIIIDPQHVRSWKSRM